MKITLIQTTLAWQNPAENRQHFTQLINAIQETDLIILPEMFTTGFTMNAAAIAEPMDGETVTWMNKMSTEKNCAVTGSLVVEEGGKYYNRLLFVEPEGTIHTYDKRQPEEVIYYTNGKDDLIDVRANWDVEQPFNLGG